MADWIAEVDLGPVLDGFKAMRSNFRAGDVARIHQAVETLRELPLPPSYLDGIRDELVQMCTGRGKITYYASCVYLAFYGEGARATYLKIGIAKDVRARLKSHTTSNPIPMLWAYFAGFDARTEATKVESALLNHMKADRIHGEWVSVGEIAQAAATAIVESLAEVASDATGGPVQFEPFEG